MPNVRLDAEFAADPAALFELARRLVDQGEGDKAMALIDAARKANPDDRCLAAFSLSITGRGMVHYHRKMLADAPRNRAYAQAIENADIKDKKVLEIGAGSGLLSMMAARAGAAKVTACEMNPMVAETARRIIAENGYSDRIRIVTGRSMDLSTEELGGEADIIIAEIFDADLVSEEVLPSIRDAHDRLVHDDTIFIPLRARAKAALIEAEPLPPLDLADIEGLDLSRFERHFPHRRWGKRGQKLQLRSDPQTIVELDLADCSTLKPHLSESILISSGGRVTGLAQWIEIDFGDGVTYSNPPGAAADSSWDVVVADFDEAIDTSSGDPVEFCHWTGDDRMIFWRK